MDTRSVLFGLMLFPLLCVSAVPVPAQAAKHAVPARHQAADEAARTQLATYLAEFQSNPDNTTLRNEIVALAKTLNPAPEIPELARADFANATAQMKAASSAADFTAAAKLFEQAAVRAPWYADAEYSAASAYAKAVDYNGARRNLAFYLAAVRPGVDIQNAEELRRDLDHQQSTQFQQAMQQFTANPSDAARLQIIKLTQAMKTLPEVPEEAHGHYVMAVVLANSAEGNPDEEQRAIGEYKAALLIAPWWGEAYKMMATAQKAAGRYDDASTSLNFYLLTQPSDARNIQDEIYRLKALGMRMADEQAKKQKEEQQSKVLEEQQQQERAANEASKFSVEGRWYEASTPNDYFVGGKSDPQCDFYVKQKGKQWVITNDCIRGKRSIDDVDVQTRQLSFRLSGNDPVAPFSVVSVTFTLSSDGQTLEGRGTAYDKTYYPVGDHPVRWMRRE